MLVARFYCPVSCVPTATATGSLTFLLSWPHRSFIFSMFARGMTVGPSKKVDADAEPKAVASTHFLSILENLWWRLDRALDLQQVYLSALVCMLECVKAGTTTLIDHHSSPSCIPGSLDAVARAAKEVGLRVNLCYEVSDRNGPAAVAEAIDENIRFMRKQANTASRDSPLISSSFGLHASFTLSEKTLQQCSSAVHALNSELGTSLGFHVHLCEDVYDVNYSLHHYHARPTSRFHKAGMLGRNTLLAHGIHVDEAERGAIRATQSMVVHNPSSNMNNAVGLTDLAPLLQQQQSLETAVVVGLGTDGMHYDMIQESKTAFLAHRSRTGDAAAFHALHLTFHNNATIASRMCAAKLGVLAKGYSADMILLDYKPPTRLSAENFGLHFLFGVASSHVHTTIVCGRMLMQNGMLLTVNEAEIMQQCRHECTKVWDKVASL